MNSANIIRPYELSIWNLQDGFISILKPYGIKTKGQIEDTSLAIKDDGTMELKFKLPMYYSQDDGFVDNPYYYNVINGNLIVNTRKVKLIFNKKQTNEKIYEFLITKINEEHGDSGAYCNIETTGLAFEELGKIGYKIVLSQDEFLLDYNNWAENDGAPANEPHATINYWCDKVFENLNWNYRIQMEWNVPSMASALKDVLGNELADKDNNKLQTILNKMESNKVYELDFISAWDVENTELISSEIHPLQEKERIVSCEKSNIYNITQDIAKTFEVYCRYEYQYDDEYHIVGKTCVFYNNYIKEKEDTLEFSFPSSIEKIVRTIDSNDIVTKMYVVPIEDTNAESGSINIANSPANKMREDYILNFDYLYTSGAINETQYNDLADYQRSMFNYNNEIENLTNLVSNYQILKTQYEANKTFYGNAITQDEERISDAVEAISALTDGKEVLEYTTNHYYRCVLVDGKVNITQEGVFDTYTFTEGETPRTVNIGIYYANSALEKTKYEGTYQLIYDENNNLVGIEGITLPKDEGLKDAVLYLTFAYKPSLKYENIKAMYEQRLAQDTANLDKANENLNDVNDKLKEANEKLAQKLKEKKKIVDKLTNSMGCAMREGSWTAENYSDYGRHYTDKFTMGSNTIDNRLSPVWDTIPFDNELTAYDKETVNQTIKWHEVINIEGLGPQIISSIISHMSDLQYGYFINDIPSVERFLQINSRMYFGFYKDNDVVKRCLILVPGVKMEYKEGSEKRLCFRNKNGEYETIKILANSDFIEAPITLCYPRIKFLDKNIKKTYDEITVKVNDELRQKFYDYSILYRYEYKDMEGNIGIDNNYYLTIDTEVLFPNMNAEITLNTAVSTASTSLYLDALKVAKENAFPKISYEADLSAVNKKILSEDFNYLTRIVKIEDKDLHLREVYGYVSELNLDLNQPWEDKIVIKNYKTKFEDLFSSIVASTEQMKSNGLYYDRAAGSFNSNGTIKGSILQSSINQNDLTYEFQSGNLTINEIDGIWARNDKGVVAIRGGGIFCATQTDSQGNYLWNTGITPSGINASQITAGQLDTNLVNVYAGDNLRLQLRGDGLFAFYADENGVIDKDKYVVHNNDGLFLKEKNEQGKMYDKVAISWDGFTIKNGNGEKLFYADENGNLNLNGLITAKEGGTIGNWIITHRGLENGDIQLIAPTNDENELDDFVVFKATDNFKVQKNGTLIATNGVFSGFIAAPNIGSVSTDDAVGQVRPSRIQALNGYEFTYDYSDLTGVPRIEKNILQFVVMFSNNATLSSVEILYKDNEEWVYGDYSNISTTDGIVSFTTVPNILTIKEGIFTEEIWNKCVYNNNIYFKVKSENEEIIFSISKIEFGNANLVLNEIRYDDTPNFVENSGTYPEEKTYYAEFFNGNTVEEALGYWYFDGVLLNEDKPSSSVTLSNSRINPNESKKLVFKYEEATRELYVTKIPSISEEDIAKNVGYYVGLKRSYGTFKNNQVLEIPVMAYYGGNELPINSISLYDTKEELSFTVINHQNFSISYNESTRLITLKSLTESKSSGSINFVINIEDNKKYLVTFSYKTNEIPNYKIKLDTNGTYYYYNNTGTLSNDTILFSVDKYDTTNITSKDTSKFLVVQESYTSYFSAPNKLDRVLSSGDRYKYTILNNLTKNVKISLYANEALEDLLDYVIIPILEYQDLDNIINENFFSWTRDFKSSVWGGENYVINEDNQGEENDAILSGTNSYIYYMPGIKLENHLEEDLTFSFDLKLDGNKNIRLILFDIDDENNNATKKILSPDLILNTIKTLGNGKSAIVANSDLIGTIVKENNIEIFSIENIGTDGIINGSDYVRLYITFKLKDIESNKHKISFGLQSGQGKIYIRKLKFEIGSSITWVEALSDVEISGNNLLSGNFRTIIEKVNGVGEDASYDLDTYVKLNTGLYTLSFSQILPNINSFYYYLSDTILVNPINTENNNFVESSLQKMSNNIITINITKNNTYLYLLNKSVEKNLTILQLKIEEGENKTPWGYDDKTLTDMFKGLSTSTNEKGELILVGLDGEEYVLGKQSSIDNLKSYVDNEISASYTSIGSSLNNFTNHIQIYENAIEINSKADVPYIKISQKFRDIDQNESSSFALNLTPTELSFLSNNNEKLAYFNNQELNVNRIKINKSIVIGNSDLTNAGQGALKVELIKDIGFVFTIVNND